MEASTTNYAPVKKKKCVCIVGAGPSGLSMIHFLLPKMNTNNNNNNNNETTGGSGNNLSSSLQDLDIVCYEKQRSAGGLWNFNWRTGVDEFGEPCHSSMYHNLVSNGPKECLEFADYSFDEHFHGTSITSFPKREILHSYILGRSIRKDHLIVSLQQQLEEEEKEREQADGKDDNNDNNNSTGNKLRNTIQFATVVRNITKDYTGNTFIVTVQNLTTKETTTSVFEYVIIATGHFSTPNMPVISGIETFPGRVLHAHDFRSGIEFKNKHVVIVGASYSAEDIGMQIMKYGGASVIVSYRTKPMGFTTFPTGMSERPLLTHIDTTDKTTTLHFKDGTSVTDCDAIIFCTGYQHHFPFLNHDPNLRLDTANVLYPHQLYKGIVREGHDNLFYMGMQDQWYTFSMFDLQALTIRDIICGTTILPSDSERKETIAEWVQRQQTNVTYYDMLHFQADYLKEELYSMITTTTANSGNGENEKQLVKSKEYYFDLDLTRQLFIDWEHDKEHNVVTYREKAFRSAVTGTIGTVPDVSWWDDK